MAGPGTRTAPVTAIGSVIGRLYGRTWRREPIVALHGCAQAPEDLAPAPAGGVALQPGSAAGGAEPRKARRDPLASGSTSTGGGPVARLRDRLVGRRVHGRHPPSGARRRDRRRVEVRHTAGRRGREPRVPAKTPRGRRAAGARLRTLGRGPPSSPGPGGQGGRDAVGQPVMLAAPQPVLPARARGPSRRWRLC